MAPRRRKILTADKLRDYLNYSPETGIFTWRTTRRRHWLLGTIAGAVHSGGYIRIYIDGREYYAHRLAWLYVHGEWPKHQIDHINGDRNDNRISNLREATSTQNHANTRIRSDNKTGMKGVSIHSGSGRWRARIMLGRKEKHLGFFETKEEAAEAYKAAAQERFGEFANPGQ